MSTVRSQHIMAKECDQNETSDALHNEPFPRASTTRLEQLRVSVGPPPLVVPRNVTVMLLDIVECEDFCREGGEYASARGRQRKSDGGQVRAMVQQRNARVPLDTASIVEGTHRCRRRVCGGGTRDAMRLGLGSATRKRQHRRAASVLLLLLTIYYLLAMVASWISLLASIGMAVGPPLVYADQAYSIVKKQYAHPSLRDLT